MIYRDAKIAVTGGLGFIGSNLSRRLLELGARVTIIDSSVPGCGANPFNLEPYGDRFRLLPFDIGEAGSFEEELRGCRVVFNLAGEISHVHSMEFPERDLRINAAAQLRFLNTLQTVTPGVRVVYASTRQVYGAPDYLPVDELHPIKPVDFNGIHKYAACMYHLLFAKSGRLDSVVLRLTNVYGPRMALDVPCQGFLSTFIRRALLCQPIEIFGNGEQLRDPVYVEDVVEAFLLAGSRSDGRSRVYNVGGAELLGVGAIAQISARLSGGPAVVCRPFPDDRKLIDIGSYYTNWSRIESELGWHPKIRFEDGLSRTVEYYRQNLGSYLNPLEENPTCRMSQHGRTRLQDTTAAAL